MSYLVHEVDQGSEEWHAVRAGKITASMFGEVMKVNGGLNEQQAEYVRLVRKKGKDRKEAASLAGYRAIPRSDVIERALAGEKVGDWTAAAKDYAFRLAVERISGKPLDEGWTGWAAQRGHELEPEARASHALICGVTVEKAGFVSTEDGLFGSSADGLIGDDEGAEYKCFIAPEKLRAIILDRDIEEYAPQCQGGMWITGRKRWHFCLYCPALRPVGKDLVSFIFERDEDYIERMESRLREFNTLVESYRQQIEDA